jgi:hypothetical protein
VPLLSQPCRASRGRKPIRQSRCADITARLLGQSLSERLGQQFLIENRPGAGTNIGTEAVVNAAADGYTLLLATSANAANATLYEKLNFNFIHDIAPVASIASETLVLVVHPSFPAKTVPELMTYAKTNPGKIEMASTGYGGGAHMFGELFKMMAGINMLHVPYRGTAPALTDLLGGQVQVMFASMPGSIEYIRAGKLRALAVTTATRSETLPDIPTVAESVPCRSHSAEEKATSFHGEWLAWEEPRAVGDLVHVRKFPTGRPWGRLCAKSNRWNIPRLAVHSCALDHSASRGQRLAKLGSKCPQHHHLDHETGPYSC